MRLHIVLVGAVANCNFARELMYQSFCERRSPVRTTVYSDHFRRLPARLESTSIVVSHAKRRTLVNVPSVLSDEDALVSVRVANEHAESHLCGPTPLRPDLVIVVGDDPDVARRASSQTRGGVDVHFFRTEMRPCPFGHGRTPSGCTRTIADAILRLVEENGRRGWIHRRSSASCSEASDSPSSSVSSSVSSSSSLSTTTAACRSSSVFSSLSLLYAE